DHRRLAQILTFTTNLEQAGDVIEENLMSHAAKRLKGGFTFSEAGKAEILRVIDRVQANVRAATGVFMTEDLRAARALAAEKAVFREMIGAATAAHLARLREGRLDTAGTSALHLDILSDLKRVNDHLVGGAAYPVLEKAGELLPTRVRAEEAESGANAT
ncbi:MAG: Na/Pi cotransporter family protein, partial [Acetobacteraceae bacterium]|nr:Na/Pi cotransporter family protein [Acetobacteraceae bacterium]